MFSQIYQNVPSDRNRQDEVESYYLRNIVIPLLDNVSVEFDERFSKNVLTACSCLIYLVPSTLDKIDCKCYEELVVSVCLFEDDLPDPELFDQEYFHWKTYWENKKGNIPDTAVLTSKVWNKICSLTYMFYCQSLRNSL